MTDRVRELLANRQLDQAEAILLTLSGDDPEVATLAGIVYAQTQRNEEASERLGSALRSDPQSVEALTWLALVRKAQGRLVDAAELATSACRFKPGDPEILNLLGVCRLANGESSEAEAAFREVLELLPNSAPAQANLGMALRLQNRGGEALAAFRRAVELDPSVATNHLQLFKQLQQLSDWEAALLALDAGLHVHPGSIPLLEAKALAQGRCGDTVAAEQTFSRIYRSSAQVSNSYAQWLQEEGRFADSEGVLRTSLQLKPIQGAAYRLLAESGGVDGVKGALLDEALGVRGQLPEAGAERMQMSFALGKLYERAAEYESAMAEYDTANALAYEIYPGCKTFDAESSSKEPEHAAELYSESFFAECPVGENLDVSPIFIVGMVRSGTTLLDQIVSSHPAVSSVGEGSFWNTVGESTHRRWELQLPDVAELTSLAQSYLRSIAPERSGQPFTDKMPLNYRSLGAIAAVFPSARFLHMRRDPFDTCLSIYSTFFGGGPNFAYRAENIAAFYRAYLSYMAHWRSVLSPDRLMELDYEELVSNPELVTRRVVNFLRLPWDDACLRPNDNPNPVTTPSRWQARQPITARSTGKRARYEVYAPVFAALPRETEKRRT